MARKPGMSFRTLKRRKRDTNGIWGHLANENSFEMGGGPRFGLPAWLLPTVSALAAIVLVVLCFQVYDLQSHKVAANDVVAKARAATFGVSCAGASGAAVGINVPVPDGYKTAVFSAAHIFDDCATGDKIPVVVSGRTYNGELFRKDPIGKVSEANADTEADIALIYVREKLPVLDPAPDAKVGDWVVEIGNPLGEIDYATFGIVTKVTDGEYWTDASTNHGNSGGPLLDKDAKVLGIVSWFRLLSENEIDSNNKSTIMDQVNGISGAKRLNNACAIIYSASPRCPFSN